MADLGRASEERLTDNVPKQRPWSAQLNMDWIK